jgi:hypothetical protein
VPLPAVRTELPAEACALVRAAIRPTVLLPGGVAVSAISGTETGDPSKIVRGLLAATNPALTPFMPVFDLVEALKSVADMGAATIPPDPIAFGEAAAKLAEKLVKLGSMVPQVAVPNLAKSVVLTIAAGMRATAGQVRAMAAHAERVEADAARALALPEPARTSLLLVVDCARGNLQVQAANEAAALEPLNRLISLVNALLELVGAPCVPALGGVDLDPGAADLLEDAADVVEAIAGAIPGGALSLPALPGPGEC